MEQQIGGIPWVLILIGVIVLGLGLAYSTLRNRGKLSRAEEGERDRVVRENIDKERIR